MFGYVTPVVEGLKKQDYILYKSFYCGICKLTGAKYGQLPRYTTNYDIAFLSVFLHDILSQDVKFVEGPCISNPFVKRVTVAENPLLEKIAAANIILCYYKAEDGVIDRDGLKYRALRNALKRPFIKASKLLPEVSELVKDSYENLRALEKSGSDVIDEVSDCFASLLKNLAESLTGKADENQKGFCYNLGKFVYLADALDDISEDFKKRRYNVFLKAFGGYENRKQFISDNLSELEFCLNSTVNRVIENFNGLKFTQSYDLMRNVVYFGLRAKVKELLKSDKKLKPPKL